MTWRGCGPEAGDPRLALSWRLTADGSPSLWSEAFRQAFHCRSGALSESRAKFIRPAQLERFRVGDRLRVVEVCVGLGYNTASLLEAANDHGLDLEWWGLELDARPLALALAEPRFRRLWRPSTLEALAQLQVHGHWDQPAFTPKDGEALEQSPRSTGTAPPSWRVGSHSDSAPHQQGLPRPSRGSWWLGDARHQLQRLPQELYGGCDLVFLDAFSPGQCPQLWTREFLGRLAALLRPEGRLLTYCTAAAVRRGFELAGLQLASLRPELEQPKPRRSEHQEPRGKHRYRHWSAGTVASPTPIPHDGLLRPLDEMERGHLLSRAAVPYRDPLGCAAPEVIEAQRREEQLRDPGMLSTSAWRRRWGVKR